VLSSTASIGRQSWSSFGIVFVWGLRYDQHQRYRLTIGSSDRGGWGLRWGKEGMDDQDKTTSFLAAHSRRSISLLDTLLGRAVSDYFIVLVPRDPTLVPADEVQQRVVGVLNRIAPNAESITTEASAQVEFFAAVRTLRGYRAPIVPPG
jgi:hypothetical protein